MTGKNDTLIAEVWAILETVCDPEVPVLSVVDLGIVRSVGVGTTGAVQVNITPTYSGCPAMDLIKWNIKAALLEQHFTDVEISTVLSPAWTTDWMSSIGKEKLKAFGIAPPTAVQQVCQPALFQRQEAVQCPLCDSYDTVLISQFGSTPCKALYRCQVCKEPFDYFKCH